MLRNVIGWRLYLLCLLGAALLLIVVRLFVVPKLDPSVAPTIGASFSQIIDSLIGATVASIIISLLVYGLIPRGTPVEEETVLLPPKSIAPELKASAEIANKWSYRGHTGRYFRTAILPILKEGASAHGRYIDVQVQVLDPDDLNVIGFFAAYRAEVNPARADYWTVDRARAEVAATILSLWAAARATSRLRCQLFLTKTVSPFTIDLSGGMAILTRESATHNALKYPAGSTFYDSMCEDLHLSGKQGREVKIEVTPIEAIETEDDVRRALDEIGIIQGGRAAIVPMILSALRRPVNPYAT